MSNGASNYFLGNYIFYARSEVKSHLSKEVADFLVKKHYLSRNNLKKFGKKDIKLIETTIKLCIAFAKCHLRELVLIEDIEYVDEFLGTMKNSNTQKKRIDIIDTTKNKFQIPSKNIFLFSKLKKDKEVKGILSKFEVSKLKDFNGKSINWKMIKMHVTSFQLKNVMRVCNYNSLIERALSKWINKNSCIIIGKDIIKIQ